MLQKFRSFVQRNQLINPDKTVLIAVSGGVDSVVMCELMRLSNYRFAIAHCNFLLRGEESDADETFVRHLALAMDVPLHVKHFETLKFAQENGLSIQMAARNLRYTWFEELMDEFDYQYVANAHHLDDQAETFFINLIRGTGLSGLHGILPKQGRVIRPLLFATRKEILEYAFVEGLQWREDSSNKSKKYLRNKLRLELMPVLHGIDPSFSRNLNNTIRILRETETIYRQKIDEGKADLLETNSNDVRILISWLEEFYPMETWLFELLRPYGFTFSVVEEIVSSLSAISGKIFFSPTHRLIRDREYLIIESFVQLDEKSDEPILAFDPLLEQQPQLPVPVSFKVERYQGFNIPDGPSIACFDYDKLTYPLYMRHWKKGDHFFPFGSKGKKKLSDFFVDNKLSIDEKERLYLLISGDDIIWITGMRSDNRYRLTDTTKKVLVAELELPPEKPTCFFG
ncbi:MAG: tRNA lysidine(34) synthetase TilS [Bacteroidales bacterium]|nr:tRNA lysidine(34) synthetase TilS [Bacteroidales bacterium]